MHVTIVGFSKTHPELKKNLEYISKIGSKDWSINIKSVNIKEQTINFTSGTLDKISNELKQKGFENVKGPNYAKTSWHITSECNIPYNIINLLKDLKWSLVIISRDENGVINWHERYPLKMD